MDYIEGICHTNLDEYKNLAWPKKFVAVPRIGERVESGEFGCASRSLKVVGITHCTFKLSEAPFIRVELNK
jgi:hypothetical protein